MELKQGNMFVTDYAPIFEKLFRFYPYYKCIDVERSKYAIFKNGLRSEIKQLIIRIVGSHIEPHLEILEATTTIRSHQPTIKRKM